MIYNRKLKLQQLAFLQISLFLREHMLLSSSLKPFEICLWLYLPVLSVVTKNVWMFCKERDNEFF